MALQKSVTEMTLIVGTKYFRHKLAKKKKKKKMLLHAHNYFLNRFDKLKYVIPIDSAHFNEYMSIYQLNVSMTSFTRNHRDMRFLGVGIMITNNKDINYVFLYTFMF